MFTCALLGGIGSLIADSVEIQEVQASTSIENSNRMVLAAKYQQQTADSDFVIIEYTILDSGTVVKPVVIASTKPALSQKLIAEVAKWEFAEQAKDTRVRQRIVFR